MKREREHTRTRLGLITDPDMPEQVAGRLGDQLAEQLGDDRGPWAVEVEVDPLTAGRSSTGEILQATQESLRCHRWDYAICLTDLPVRVNYRPVLADANVDERVAVISLPALGATQPQRRAQQVVLQLVDELTESGGQPTTEQHNDQRHGLKSPLTELLAPIHRETTTEQQGEVDVRYSATRLRGRARLLAGMVRTNRPWRLIFGLSSALVAAIATSAFGLSSSTIWQLGDQLGALRQSVAALAAVAVLVIWLIAAHHLWETRSSNGTSDSEKIWLYNASTVLTLTIGVGCLYLGLFAINLAAAAFLVPPALLTSTLGHPVVWTTYIALAWGFTTMGVVAGALGSSLETDQAVRQAAYGYRENQRRAQHQRDDTTW